ncbi:MAG: AEC family transporter [Chloroflexota bacterium]
MPGKTTKKKNKSTTQNIAVTALLTIFTNNLLPIILISAAGFALGKTLSVDPRPLGRVLFYILSPVLIFHLLTNSQLSLGSIALTMGFATAVMLTVAGLAYLTGRLLRLERTVLTAVVLTSLLTNSGNYGLPLVAFAFGEQALAFAGVYYITSAILLNTVGIFIASLGKLRPRDALVSMLKVPTVYAILAAVVIVQAGWTLPTPLARTVELAANGAVPAMLVLLGLELQRAEWTRDIKAISISTVMRLVVAPLLAIGLSAVLGMQGAERQAGITQSGMPAAVMSTVVASEYNLQPTLVTTIVFVSTLLSPLTLTALLFFLGK